MDVGLRTPLLDFFRRGEVARDIRLLAAEGAVAPRPLEQLGLLALLTGDVASNPMVRRPDPMRTFRWSTPIRPTTVPRRSR